MQIEKNKHQEIVKSGSKNKKHLRGSSSDPITPLGHHTEDSPMGLGQYVGVGGYCGPHTVSSVFLILVLLKWRNV